MEVKITKLDQNSTTSSKKNHTKNISNNEENQREHVNLQPLYDESTLQSERSRKSQSGGHKKSKEDEINNVQQKEIIEEEITDEESINNDSDEDLDEQEQEQEEEDELEEDDEEIEEIDITEDPLYQVLSAVLEDEEGNNIVESINELKQAILINTQYIKRIAHAIEKLVDKK
jgi:hypothetical protein